MSQHKDAQQRWVNVDDQTGMATHVHDGTNWVEIQPYPFFQTQQQPIPAAPTSPVGGVTTYAGMSSGDDIAGPLFYEPSSEELQAEAARVAAQRRYGDQPVAVKLQDGMWFWILPPFRQGTWAQRLLRHFNFTDGNWPVECLEMHNLPCPLCKYVAQLEEVKQQFGYDDKKIRDLKSNETYTYLVFLMDEPTGQVKEFQLGQRQLVVSTSMHAIVSNLIGTTPGILSPSQSRPLRAFKATVRGQQRWNANIFHSQHPIINAQPEMMEYLTNNLFDLRKLVKAPAHSELEKVLMEAIQAGRVPNLSQFQQGGFGGFGGGGLRTMQPQFPNQQFAGQQPQFTGQQYVPQPQPQQYFAPQPQQFPPQQPTTGTPLPPQPSTVSGPVAPPVAAPQTMPAPVNPAEAAANIPAAPPAHSVGAKLTDQLANIPTPPPSGTPA